MKLCVMCQTSKPFDNFYKKSGRVDQFMSYCKECWSIRRAEYHIKRQHEEHAAGTKQQYIKRNIKCPNNSNGRSQYQVEYHKVRKASDLNYRILSNMRIRLHKALHGITKSKATLSLVGCSIQELRSHLSHKFQPGMTWSNYGDWHIDHIKPLSKFNLEDPTQQKLACHYTNLQPLWAHENLKKGDSYEEKT